MTQPTSNSLSSLLREHFEGRDAAHEVWFDSTDAELICTAAHEIERLQSELHTARVDLEQAKMMKRLAEGPTPEPEDGFTDALAQALYGHDPGAVSCAMKHADTIVGDTTDAHALRRLAEEVRRLRAEQTPADAKPIEVWSVGFDGMVELSESVTVEDTLYRHPPASPQPPGADEPLRLLREAYFFVQDDFPENFPPDLLALSDVCATERYLKFWQDLSRYLASTVRYEPESPTATKGGE